MDESYPYHGSNSWQRFTTLGMLIITTMPQDQVGAIGLIRVSHVGERKGEHFVSPREQRQSIEAVCQRENLNPVAILEEMNVSGGKDIDRRPGLSRALGMIERGEARVLVVAYFDRLFRHLGVQAEVLKRVEEVGGEVLTVDAGRIRADTASHWLSATMMGAVAEYHRRITSEKVSAAKEDAVRRGVCPFPIIVPGYRRGPDGVLVVHEAEAAIVREAFRLRVEGATFLQIRDYLHKRGIKRSYRATQTLLKSRMVLGEIHSGKLVNTAAHPPIVGAHLWQLAQLTRLPRGKTSPSDRLLARLGVLKCGTCGSLMAATYGYKQRGGPKYWKYFCGMKTECARPAMISATVIEGLVVDKIRALIGDESGSASMEAKVAEAEAELARRQDALDAAITAFSGLNAALANQRLLLLEEGVREALRHVTTLRAGLLPARTVSLADWDRMVISERRALIRATLSGVVVDAGRGTDRVRFLERGKVLGEEPSSDAVEDPAHLDSD